MTQDLAARGQVVVTGVWAALPGLLPDADLTTIREAAEQRGYFRPDEETRLFAWFAQILTARAALLDTILELETALGGLPDDPGDAHTRRCFLVGYAAACLLVRLDRLVVEDVAVHRITQRKLNEGHLPLHLPRKAYTALFKSLTDPGNAWRMYRAMRFAAKHAATFDALADDAVVGRLAVGRARLETYLDPKKRNYLRRAWFYRDHATRRRGVTSLQRVTFHLLGLGGRVVSELNPSWKAKKVSAPVRARLEAMLQPGDVLVTRHKYAATNLFLPGYWPHAALYIGPPESREALRIDAAPDILSRWTGAVRTLEALKDGVRLRSLEETLAVDAVAVIRPNLPPEAIAAGIGRALQHEGKGYNFDFDFFSTNRLVCTEVVYRAYDGLWDQPLPLQRRSGRPTLSAEDLLELALAGDLFTPVALFGTADAADILTGPALRTALVRSFKESDDPIAQP